MSKLKQTILIIIFLFKQLVSKLGNLPWKILNRDRLFSIAHTEIQSENLYSMIDNYQRIGLGNIESFLGKLLEWINASLNNCMLEVK